MPMPASRMTDMHVCPMVTGIVPHVGGPIMPPCAPTVLTGFLPQARVGDMCVCVGPPDVIVTGAFTVLVSGKPAARMMDTTAHGGKIILGWSTVLIGDSGGGGGGGGGGMPGGGGSASTNAPFTFETWKASAEPGKEAAQNSQATTLTGASSDGQPFCEVCNR